MLVISRRMDEALVIGDNVVISVIEIRGDKVRIGIEAPRDVSVHRREVWELIHQPRDPETSPLRLEPIFMPAIPVRLPVPEPEPNYEQWQPNTRRG